MNPANFDSDNEVSRQDIRRLMRRRRRSLTADQQRQAAVAVEYQITRLAIFRNARRIGCYLANDGELDIQAVIARILSMNKCCYLPVLDRLGHNRLWFAPLTSQTPLSLNRFGIHEPLVAPRHLISAGQLDLLLLPLVAFDLQGNRLGMGGGFYDRSLAFLKRRQHWRKPHLYGVAHDFQCVPSLRQATWDIPLQGIIANSGVYQIKRGKRD